MLLYSSYQWSVLFITYIAYVCYHMTRKPISVVKAVLQNCTQDPEHLGITDNFPQSTVHQGDSGCGYPPFGKIPISPSSGIAFITTTSYRWPEFGRAVWRLGSVVSLGLRYRHVCLGIYRGTDVIALFSLARHDHERILLLPVRCSQDS